MGECHYATPMQAFGKGNEGRFLNFSPAGMPADADFF
jgi:hypothetical protein